MKSFQKIGLSLFIPLALHMAEPKVSAQETKPNIIVILADDLGYGDVSAYGPYGINTPNIDRIASGGIRFTNCYATAATCTPSRYSLITGLYPWRNDQAKILPGDAPLIIQPEIHTLPKLLKQAGYVTGVVGKWHLGLGNGVINWNSEIKPGPESVGFDYHYIFPATSDRVPCVYIEQNHIVNLDQLDPVQVSYTENFAGEPTGADQPKLLKMYPSHGHENTIVNGVSRIGFMKGGKSARWVDEAMGQVFLSKANEFVRIHKNQPFFLYYALHQPHVPRLPNPYFAGKSGLGPRGDAILEADWCVGKLLDNLKKLGLDKNTIVIFSSDNGPVLDDGYKDDAVEKNGKHKPAGLLRGGKYSLYNGGTQIPFLIRWPGTIQPGVSNVLVSQLDLLASFAHMVGQTPDANSDSENLMDVFLGKSKEGRQSIVLEGIKNLAIRSGNWVFIPAYTEVSDMPNESGLMDKVQLFQISTDIEQKEDFSDKFPEKVQELKLELEHISGRTLR